MNIEFNPPSSIRIPLKPFHQGNVDHRTGIACNINDKEFDMLFDTGAEHPRIAHDNDNNFF
ncbi:MAG: hypothetical protein WAM14_00145 [Candidatus Nitrosopolaris sp.]